MPHQVTCPQCRKQVPFEGNPHRPFCSERCRRIDLGTWASEGYIISGKGSEIEDSNVSTNGEEGETPDSNKE